MSRAAVLLVMLVGCANTADPREDASAPAQTCAELRVCAASCNDAACLERCRSAAPVAPREAFDRLRACQVQACPNGDVDCRCGAECFFPGPCAALLDACTDGADDAFCDGRCH